MGEFFKALFAEASLAFVFLLICSPLAIVPIVYYVRYVSFFPRFYIGRLRLAAKLEKITKKYGLEFYRHREQYYYGRLEQADCEFSIVTPKARYAVKLIGMPNRNLNLYLTDHNAYYTQKPRTRRDQGRSQSLYTKEERTRLARQGNFRGLNYLELPEEVHDIPPHRYFVPDERVREDDIVPVYLINPCPRNLYYKRNHSNERSQPYDGENLDGITLFTLTGFLKQIEKDCTPEEEE